MNMFEQFNTVSTDWFLHVALLCYGILINKKSIINVAVLLNKCITHPAVKKAFIDHTSAKLWYVLTVGGPAFRQHAKICTKKLLSKNTSFRAILRTCSILTRFNCFASKSDCFYNLYNPLERSTQRLRNNIGSSYSNYFSTTGFSYCYYSMFVQD